MTEEIIFKDIKNDDLSVYEDLMVPMVYEELSRAESIETEYLALSAWLDDKPACVIVADPEDSGDINILSVWTDQKYRRRGVASDLFDKLMELVSALYNWDELEYGDDIEIRTMYCLDDAFRKPYEGWLEAKGFSDFSVLREAEGDRPAICGAAAEMHLFRFEQIIL